MDEVGVLLFSVASRHCSPRIELKRLVPQPFALFADTPDFCSPADGTGLPLPLPAAGALLVVIDSLSLSDGLPPPPCHGPLLFACGAGQAGGPCCGLRGAPVFQAGDCDFCGEGGPLLSANFGGGGGAVGAFLSSLDT